MELCPLKGFQILSFLKIFITDSSGTMIARKLKVRINMDNRSRFLRNRES